MPPKPGTDPDNRKTPVDRLRAALGQLRPDKFLREAQEEIDDHRREMAGRAKDGNDLRKLLDDVILDGLEIRFQLLQCAQVASENPDSFTFPSGRTGRELTTKCQVWLAKVEACISRWRKHRWQSIERGFSHLSALVRPGGGTTVVGIPFVEDTERILDELRGIVPQLQIMNFDIDRRVREQLTGDELNHAEQLLQIEGQHEEAILRAAGVIAGVVLEGHLANIVRQQNRRIPEADHYNFDKSNSIARYASWLIGQGIIPPTERTALVESLNFIRNCCDHAPTDKLRVPTKDEVERLIRDTRKYVGKIGIET